MGNVLRKKAKTVTITVETGNIKFLKQPNELCWSIKDKVWTYGLVDGRHKVIMRLADTNDRKTEDMTVTIRSIKKKGQTKKFTLKDLSKHVDKGFGDIKYLEIWRKHGITTDRVFIYHLDIEFVGTDLKLIFPIHRWIPHGKILCIRPNDSFLPQYDIFPKIRKEELEAKRTVYQLVEKEDGLPPQCAELPEDEKFSADYDSDFTNTAIALTIKSKLAGFVVWSAYSLTDLKGLYCFEDFKLPECAEKDWFLEDEYFGEQRLAGCNPTQIKLCTAIPESFAVTDEMLRPFMENKSLQSVMDEKRLFITDYTILANLATTYPKWEVPAPFALFYRNSTNQLLPIAIQLQQRPHKDNPIFLPNDPDKTWLLAKMWANLADSTIHQGKVHLGFTHLVAETICVTTHRELSPSHPIFRLLAPHFLYLIAINDLAMTTLVSPEGQLDHTMAMGRKGTFDVVRRSKIDWRFDVDGNPKTEVEKRRVGKDVLPHYPYRDDAIALYEAIQEYVTDVAQGVYKNKSDLKNDDEIQSWYKELSKPVAHGGGGFKGIPGDGQMATIDNIISILATTIFISSVQHAAVNFNQYEQYAFPAVYPAHLNGTPPTSKEALEDKDILAALPGTSETCQLMVLTKLLSNRGTNPLGDFEVQYAFDPIALDALEKFRSRLDVLSNEILTGHPERKYPYTILNPKEIPNAISI